LEQAKGNQVLVAIDTCLATTPNKKEFRCWKIYMKRVNPGFLREIGFGDVDWIHWAQDRDR
jgi:hypothetical protein